jgi:hypothetical protein
MKMMMRNGAAQQSNVDVDDVGEQPLAALGDRADVAAAPRDVSHLPLRDAYVDVVDDRCSSNIGKQSMRKVLCCVFVNKVVN